MPVALTPAGGTVPRRARYLIPRDVPRRTEIIGALSLLAVAAHLLFAPLTLVLVAVFQMVSRVSRWRPLWLLGPAAAGLAWLLAIGPAAALAGFTAGPRAVTGLLSAAAADPARLARLGAVTGEVLRSLPGQAPLALVAAAAEAAAAWWAGWLHTDSWDLLPARPGLLVLCRQRLTAAQVRAGAVVTRDGACLGVDQLSGQPAAVSWPEASGGVLVTGASWAAVSAAGFQLVHAAVRRRKPVIAVDLAGDPAFTASLAAACAAAAAPLQVFGPDGTGLADPPAAGVPGYYEPLQAGSPARKAALVMGMTDWAGRAETARRDYTAVLTDIFAVAAAAPAGPEVPVLDDVIRLLDPAVLCARLGRVPAYHPRLAALTGRVQASAARIEADPDPAALLTGQLTALRASPLGRWLAPGPPPGQPGTRISLGGVLRERSVTLFSLGRSAHGRAAEMIATLVALDAAGVFAGLHRAGAGGEGLAWFGRCEAAGQAALAELLAVGSQAGLAAGSQAGLAAGSQAGLAAGSQAGLACVLGTTSAEAAARLAGQVRVLAVHRLADPALAAQLAPLTGTKLVRADPAAAAGLVSAAAGLPAAGLPSAGMLTSAAVPAAGPGAAGFAAAGLPGQPGGPPVGPVPATAVPGTAIPPAALAAATAGPPAGAAVTPAASFPPAAAVPFGLVRCPVVPAGELCALRDGEFVLIAGQPAGRVVPSARAVPAAVPAPRPVRPARLARLATAGPAGEPGSTGWRGRLPRAGGGGS